MPAYYTVVQFTPDPVIDERINIGVIVYGDGRVRAHFLQNWNRVRQFGAKVRPLQEFARDASRMTEDMVHDAAGRWINSIQLTKPAASLLTPDVLLLDVAKRFLVDPPTTQRHYRTRQDAVRIVRRNVVAALRSRIGGLAVELVKDHFPLQGQTDKHEFDLSVTNGSPFFAVQGLSFEGPDSNELIKQVRATAWSIEDVRRRNRTLPLAVVMLCSRDPSDVYDRAMHTFGSLPVETVSEGQVDAWSERMANLVSV